MNLCVKGFVIFLICIFIKNIIEYVKICIMNFGRVLRFFFWDLY